MARLSIIDLKSKNLCLYQENNYILTYNGEIYNFKEIKQGSNLRELNLKQIVILSLKSFIYWGKNALENLTECLQLGSMILKAKLLVRICRRKTTYYIKKIKILLLLVKKLYKNFELSKNPNRKF